MLTCENCGHDWHGLACSHEAVVRAGWALTKETCACAHSVIPQSA